MKEEFNLTTEPWIKVIDNENHIKLVSLIEVFKNSQNYRQLAGEMKMQDLSILRFLLAILTTVYSRFTKDGQVYDWIKLDEKMQVKSVDEDLYNPDDLLETWSQLYTDKKFSNIVVEYLEEYKIKFDFLSKGYPFYQVNRSDYDNLVPATKSVENAITKGTGTVSIKQINRTISESGNSPAIFSPKAKRYKNKININELVRWVITYQNFTGVTDKTKVNADEKFSVSSGWLYGLNPVFIQGNNLFETLILNLKLIEDTEEYTIQKPFWEYRDIIEYIQKAKSAILPNNISELYTLWSRVMHIEWINDQPILSVAGLPKIDSSNAFVEPMTTWKWDKKNKIYKPAVRWIKSYEKAMWRNFGEYVDTMSDDNVHQPGIVTWLKILKKSKLISENRLLNLTTIDVISDGNATSQAPVIEIYDDMKINADVLFDKDIDRSTYWPAVIESVINVTQSVGDNYWHFAKDVGKLRNLSDSATFASKTSANFYESLNEPFYGWLASLSNNEERDCKVRQWKKTLDNIAHQAAESLFRQTSFAEIRGRKNGEDITNIFVLYRFFNAKLSKLLNN